MKKLILPHIVMTFVLISTLLTSCVSPQQKKSTSTSTVSVQESEHDGLIISAEQRGFKRGVIQHCINTYWSDFGDGQYYEYVKTLNSGMELYRFESEKIMMEVYVWDGIIKMQSSTFILYNETAQLIKEMDAWIMTCNPQATDGDIGSEKNYELSDIIVTLIRNEIGVQMMISAKN